jgi:hypothetical protein
MRRRIAAVATLILASGVAGCAQPGNRTASVEHP